jgi:hypothetical protein
MNEPRRSIVSILDDLGIDARQVSAVMIGLPETDSPDFGAVEAYETVTGPGDLPPTLRAQLGIVVAPLDYMPRANAEQLLSRLRDVHCDKVLLVDGASGWSPDALRSLGYLEVKRPSDGARCYMFDPDTFNQPREWNNSSDWANPENFQKYRW